MKLKPTFILKVILIAFFSIGLMSLLIRLIFTKERILIKNIYERSFNDTIVNVYQTRLVKGSSVFLTEIKSNDTPVFINGINNIKNILYMQIASKGDVLIKGAYKDSFYIKKGENFVGFKLLK
jgi:hypothetical protein